MTQELQVQIDSILISLTSLKRMILDTNHALGKLELQVSKLEQEY